MVGGWNPSGGKIFHACQEFPQGRAAGAWFTPPPPKFSSEVKERVELYLCSSGFSVLGLTSRYLN